MDGTVICSARLPNKKLVPLLQRHTAVVLVNRFVPTETCDTVAVDDGGGAARAVQHLQSGGRSSIACLMGPARLQSARKRLKGYERALDISGHPVASELIVACAPTEEGGYRGARKLLSGRSGIDGLICFNDLVAIGAVRACHDLSVRVPDDLAVVGFDDILLASLVTPALTTLRISKYDIGTTAVRLLLERIGGRSQRRKIVLTPELMVRASAP